MSVSEAVSAIANQLERQLGPLSDTHTRMLAVIKEMPIYVANNTLADWQTAYRDSAVNADESDDTFRLIESVYELGAFNLFGAFDIRGTQKYYRQLCLTLSEHGISVSEDMVVSSW